jgi:hypothetical protein
MHHGHKVPVQINVENNIEPLATPSTYKTPITLSKPAQ